MYYSRFTREDIYTAFWTFGLVIFIWRYMASQENKWLLLGRRLHGRLFCTKETTFMTVAAFSAVRRLPAARYISRRSAPSHAGMNDLMFGGLTAAMMSTAPVIAIGWPFLKDWRAKYDIDEMPAGSAHLLIVMGSLAVTQYAAAHPDAAVLRQDVAEPRAGETGDLHMATRSRPSPIIDVFGLIGISAAIGLTGGAKTWALAAACFWIPFVLLVDDVLHQPERVLLRHVGLDGLLDLPAGRRPRQPARVLLLHDHPGLRVPAARSCRSRRTVLRNPRQRDNAMMFGAGLARDPRAASSAAQRQPRDLEGAAVHVWVPFGLVLSASSSTDGYVHRFLVVLGGERRRSRSPSPARRCRGSTCTSRSPLAILAARFVGEMLRPQRPPRTIFRSSKAWRHSSYAADRVRAAISCS